MVARAVTSEGGLDSLKATELRLGLPGTEDIEPRKPAAPAPTSRGSKRAFAEADEDETRPKGSCTEAGSGAENPPAAKAQVVGWPPIRSHRKSCLQGTKAEAEAPGAYVKVSMDGAPYLRKVDLGAYRGYRELREALEGMFKGFSQGFSGGEEGCGVSEHAITYEDKDGDWMLAGDVPWEMFTRSCKRLRIMRGCEARGLGSSPCSDLLEHTRKPVNR